MNKICPYESSVARAACTGQWEDPIEAHLAACAACREAARIAQWMGRLAEHVQSEEPLPDPGLLWFKAQIAEQDARDERVLRPLAIVWRLTQAGLALASAGWFVWNRTQIESWLRNVSLEPLHWQTFAASIEKSLPYFEPSVALSLVLTAFGLLLSLVIYPVLTKE